MEGGGGGEHSQTKVPITFESFLQSISKVSKKNRLQSRIFYMFLYFFLGRQLYDQVCECGRRWSRQQIHLQLDQK